MPHGCEPVQALGESLHKELSEVKIKASEACDGMRWVQWCVGISVAVLMLCCGAWKLADDGKHLRVDEKFKDIQSAYRESHARCEETRSIVQEQAKAIVKIETTLPRIEVAQRAAEKKLDAFINEWRESRRDNDGR
jgi:hypothetical protein